MLQSILFFAAVTAISYQKLDLNSFVSNRKTGRSASDFNPPSEERSRIDC